MRVCYITFIMRFLAKYGTFLPFVYFVSATHMTTVQNNAKLSKESYFKQLQTGREIIGAAGEEIKVRSNIECSYGYLQLYPEALHQITTKSLLRS